MNTQLQSSNQYKYSHFICGTASKPISKHNSIICPHPNKKKHNSMNKTQSLTDWSSNFKIYLKLRQSLGTLILCCKLDLGCLKMAAELTASFSMGSSGSSTGSSSSSSSPSPPMLSIFPVSGLSLYRE